MIFPLNLLYLDIALVKGVLILSRGQWVHLEGSVQSNSMCKPMLEGGNLAESAGCVGGTDTLESRPIRTRRKPGTA